MACSEVARKQEHLGKIVRFIVWVVESSVETRSRCGNVFSQALFFCAATSSKLKNKMGNLHLKKRRTHSHVPGAAVTILKNENTLLLQ